MPANDLRSPRLPASTRFGSVLTGALAVVGMLLCVSASGCKQTGSEDPVSSPGADDGTTPGKVCTQIGCYDGFSVSLEPSSGMPAGAYTFEVEIDGAVTTCEGSLPLAACEAGPSVTCSTDAVAIGESGCAMEAASQGFDQVLFAAPKTPKAVKLTISHDGEVVGAGEFAPEYRQVQPNGPGCAPTCEQAEATLELTAAPQG